MNKNIVLICPRNDEESLMILKIAEAMRLPVVESAQSHGAKLHFEPELLNRIRMADPQASKVAIVEIPGKEAEKRLREDGFEVIIIDHHEYEELNRMKKKSSLEQFLDVYEIAGVDLEMAGIRTDLVAGVAAMDRGFLAELKKEDFSSDERREIIKFYKQLRREVRGSVCDQEDLAAKEAWEKKRERGGVLIIESPKDDVSIRDAVSYLIHDAYEEVPTSIIAQGSTKVYVQNTSKTSELHQKFGGFTFGGGRCWGAQSDEGAAPTIDEITKIVVK